MLFSLAVSWRFRVLYCDRYCAGRQSGKAAWPRKFASGLFVPSFAIGPDDLPQIKAVLECARLDNSSTTG
jgi:hypothetical protein